MESVRRAFVIGRDEDLTRLRSMTAGSDTLLANAALAGLVASNDSDAPCSPCRVRRVDCEDGVGFRLGQSSLGDTGRYAILLPWQPRDLIRD